MLAHNLRLFLLRPVAGTILEGDDAATTKHDSQEQGRDYRDDDRTQAP